MNLQKSLIQAIKDEFNDEKDGAKTVEIKSLGAGCYEITIDETEDNGDVSLTEFLTKGTQIPTEIELTAKATAILISSFKETIKNFLKGVDELIVSDDAWTLALNKIFDEAAKTNNKNYKIQVIEA